MTENNTNPLYAICKNASKKWMHPMDLAVFIGFQMKLAGFDWSTNKELSAILDTLTDLNFLQYDKQHDVARVNPYYIDTYGNNQSQEINPITGIKRA